ncbi:helix-turn-helix domain-containing protein, partial [Streptomyces sp. SID625]|nr:helix-turn-helix domain-containing protein [Streptomyces sp. SID625]
MGVPSSCAPRIGGAQCVLPLPRQVRHRHRGRGPCGTARSSRPARRERRDAPPACADAGRRDGRRDRGADLRGWGTPDLDALLREQRERSGLSYEALAGRCGASASAVHRYWRGRVVPGSYGMVERIGTACGASRQELHALYEAWRSASAVTAVRERPVRERVVGEGPVSGPRPRRPLPRAERRCRRPCGL